MKTIASFTLAVLLFLGTDAYALLVEVDLFSAGDALITNDTSTNLEWLDFGNSGKLQRK